MSDDRAGRALGETRRREVLAIVSVGGTRDVAARYVGCPLAAIDKTALQDAEFRKSLHRAESQHEIGNLQSIQTAAKKESNWRAAAWTLERKYPQRYAPRAATTVTVEQVAHFLTKLGEVIASEIPDETLRRRIMRRLKRLFASPSKAKSRGRKRG